MGIKKVKAVELVLDWNLWPRYEAEDLDSTNVNRMKEALRAGVQLPPVVVNKSDLRVIDGFHRIKATLAVFGDDATINADMREYENEAAMFLDSVALNASQGLPLSPRDVVHSILRARKFKIPIPAIGKATGLSPESIKRLLERRTATTQSGEKIPLTGGSLALAGKTLTAVQEHHVRHSNGTIPIMHARMLLNALRADAAIVDDKLVAILKELMGEIGEILMEVAA